MKSGFKALGIALVTLHLLQPAGRAADTKAAAPATTTTTTTLTNQLGKVSYSLGMFVANNLIKRNGFEVDVDIMALAIKDVLAGRQLQLTDQQVNEIMQAYERELRAKRDLERNRLAEKNRQAGEAYLAANRNKPGVKTHQVQVSDTVTAELQYKVMAEGAGELPQVTDIAVINLKGTSIDGKEFDNGTARKSPIGRLPLGLREALQRMKPGAKWQIAMPSALGYGDFGYGQTVEPGAALLYELELVGIDVPQPLTSDIVMVPSADQIKAGSNVITIKPEDVKRMMSNTPPIAPKK